MLDAFWNAVAGRLADRWAAVAAPALVFWTGAVSAWAFHGTGWSQLSEITDWLTNQEVAGQIAGLLGALLVVFASAIIVERLALPVLRLLEGYWPSWLDWLAARRLKNVEARRSADDEVFQRLQAELDERGPTGMSAVELDELARVERSRQRHPVLNNELLPTRLGNTLRAAETRPWHRYGLEAVSVWPRLWMLLPDTARKEIAAARAELDSAVAAAIWGVAFIALTPLAWWAAPTGTVVAVVALRWWAPARAEVFANLTEATYDLYRGVLYEQLRWPLPETPADERESGQALTRYVVRGSRSTTPRFTPSRTKSQRPQ